MRRNYFAGEDVAKRYATGRPYFHPLVVGKIAEFLGLDEPVDTALDVACGTGLSAIALTEIASLVNGIDISSGILGRAGRNDRVRYVEAAAEDLPFDTKSFDLVTASSAFHWFDRARFLSEARRVLRISGWPIIYDNYFFGRMRENDEFGRWYRDRYLPRYPITNRDRRPFIEEEAEEYGFRFAEREEYANDVSFSVEELAGYFETQSNVMAAVEAGKASIEEVHEWLLGSPAPLYHGRKATPEFGGHIWFLEAVPIGVNGV